ncbi:MAG TPA: amidase, partial [Bryobacteraceae bacterium]|nr:amidase [Bryobacteraceae bacterium]
RSATLNRFQVSMPRESTPKIPRRVWMQLMGALAAGPALKAQPPATPTTAPPPQGSIALVPQRVTKDMAVAALATLGLTFADPQIDMLLPTVNRLYARYEELRKIDIPSETPPAILFSPVIAGYPAPRGRSTWRPGKAPALIRYAQPDELAFSTALQLGAMIRAKRITSASLTRMYLDRLKMYGPKLNCVITLTEDLALEQAKQADASLRRGRHLSPLHGVPYGAKDLFDTKGILTTWGAEPYQHRVPDSDATVIERLRAAGAVLVAKLSMGALAQGGLWFGGMTKTPWNYDQTSSGSSAGSASATSAGLVGFSIGTETLGSIVSPSTRCGVAGVRPTFGRVSRAGAMALSWSMDKIGPICRSVADCAEVLRIMAGPDGKDLTVLNAPLHWDARRNVKRLKVGYLSADFERLREKPKPVLEAALADLRKAGVQMEPMALPDFPLQAVNIVLDAEAATAFDDLTRQPGGLEQLSGQASSDWPNQFRSSRLIPAVEYIRAQRARTIYMRKFHEAMDQWDAFVSPTNSLSLTATNLTGHPQVVVPCGFVDGLPQGLLFTSRLFEEGTAMRLAYAYEQATDWHTKHPTLQT